MKCQTGTLSPLTEQGSGAVAIEVVRVSDEELERLAKERGRLSLEAHIIDELRQFRSMDRQVYTFRVGNYYFTGPRSRRAD